MCIAENNIVLYLMSKTLSARINEQQQRTSHIEFVRSTVRRLNRKFSLYTVHCCSQRYIHKQSHRKFSIRTFIIWNENDELCSFPIHLNVNAIKVYTFLFRYHKNLPRLLITIKLDIEGFVLKVDEYSNSYELDDTFTYVYFWDTTLFILVRL